MPKKISMLVCGGGCVVVVIEMDDTIPSGWQLIFSGTYNCIAQKITQIALNAQQRVKYRVNGKRTELLVHYTNQYDNRQQNVANQKMEKHPIRSKHFFSLYQKNPETSYINSYASCVSICRFYFSVFFFSLISLFSSGFNLFTKWIAWRAHTVSSSSSSTLLSNIKSQHRFVLVILVGARAFLSYHIVLLSMRTSWVRPLIDVSNSIVVIIIRLNTIHFKCVCGTKCMSCCAYMRYNAVFVMRNASLYILSFITAFRSHCFV